MVGASVPEVWAGHSALHMVTAVLEGCWTLLSSADQQDALLPRVAVSATTCHCKDQCPRVQQCHFAVLQLIRGELCGCQSFSEAPVAAADVLSRQE